VEIETLAEADCNGVHKQAASAGPNVGPGTLCTGASPPDVVDILGTPISAVDERTFLNRLEDWLARRAPTTEGIYVVFRDVHGVVRARNEPTLAEAHLQAFMNVPDGAPLSWVCRLRGRQAGRVTGTETLNAVCAAGVNKGWRHAFYGSRPDVLNALVPTLADTYPGIRIVLAIAPPNRPLTQAETADHIRQLAAAKPDFVWVGLGCPKQELWMARNARLLPGAIAMGVGAAFDFQAGTVRRAPALIRRLGLEFAYRIAQEPRRLAGRYAQAIPRFVLGVIAEEITRRVRRRA
jgi:N-acetylglucosaminyldiphosphoundecaprenol N-acetyl-beta-D-mannosaminyltransferase